MSKVVGAFGVLLTSLLLGCTTVFYQPTGVDYKYAEAEHLDYQSLEIKSEDGTKLAARYFESSQIRKTHQQWAHYHGPTKGLVAQFHGNAQNMTAHFMNVAWLLFEGYDLLVFDYRGYGASEGSLSVRGVNEDAQSALKFASTEAKKRGLPLIAYGQSLGGSTLLRALEDDPIPNNLKLVIVESSFYSYQKIAREKLASVWFLWPFQWLAYLLVSDSYSPGTEKLQRIKPVPKILFYSEHDPVVSINHGEKFYQGLPEPKKFIRVPEPGHISTMYVDGGRNRKVLLDEIAGAIRK